MLNASLSAATTSPLIDVRGLSVALGGRSILDGVDLTVSAGEIVTLIGPNGAGKTTLVRAVLGLVGASAGTVWRRPSLRIGYMPQKLSIDRTLPLTVRRFLSLWRKTDGPAIDTVLATAGVAHLASAAVQTVSGGELQRVLLARALLGAPDLLVLDEPDQALDLNGRAELFARIDQVRAQTGCGVLMVSHDLYTVMARTHTVVCVDRCIRCSGPPEDVREHPEFAQMFGPLAGQIAVYHHRHERPERGAAHG